MSPQSQRDWRAVADGQLLLLIPGSESTESSLHSSHLKFLFPLVLLCRTAGHQLPQCQCATVGHISFLREGSCFLLHTEFAVTLIIIELLQIGVIFIMAGVLDHVSAIFGGSADFGRKLKQLQIIGQFAYLAGTLRIGHHQDRRKLFLFKISQCSDVRRNINQRE